MLRIPPSPNPVGNRSERISWSQAAHAALATLLIPGLALPAAGLAQNAPPASSTPSVLDPITLPSEREEEASKPPAAAMTPWWTTNRPPSSLVNGPQLGTDVIGILNPSLNVVPPPVARPMTPSGTPEAFRWGPVTAHPHISYGVAYANGIVPGPTQDDYSFINTVSPGVTLELGKRWTVDYTPSLVFYTDDAFENVVNQNVTVQGTGTEGDWNLGFGNLFSMTDNPLIETGVQTQQTVNTTQITANRPLTPVLSLGLGVNQALRWTDDFNNTFSWSTLNGVDYELSPRLTVGADVGFGYDLVDPGTDMLNERFLLSASGLLGSKFSYVFSGGFEVRQFLESGSETKLSPILNLALNYAVSEKTVLNLYGIRQVSPSYNTDQYTEFASLGGGVSQRLFRRFWLSLSGGYRWSDYNSTFDPTQTVQTQDYAFANASLSTQFLRRGTASIYYTWSSNKSNIRADDLNSNQFGAQLGFGW